MSVDSSGHPFGQICCHGVHDGCDGGWSWRRRQVVQLFSSCRRRPAAVVHRVVVVLLCQLVKLMLLLFAAQPVDSFLKSEILGIKNFEFALNLENDIQMELIFKKTVKENVNFDCHFLVRYCFYSVPLFWCAIWLIGKENYRFSLMLALYFNLEISNW